jgi:hypothetical protein
MCFLVNQRALAWRASVDVNVYVLQRLASAVLLLRQALGADLAPSIPGYSFQSTVSILAPLRLWIFFWQLLLEKTLSTEPFGARACVFVIPYILL